MKFPNLTLILWASAAFLTVCFPCVALSAVPTDQKPIVAQPQKESAGIVAALKRGTISDLKGGMTQAELFRLLGAPASVEGKSNYEIWTYPSGTVFFSPKAGVIAWKETKWTTTISMGTSPQSQLP